MQLHPASMGQKGKHYIQSEDPGRDRGRAGEGATEKKETEAEGGGGREGGKEREGSCQERPVQPNGELALLGLCCPLVAFVSRLGCPHLEPGNAGAGRSLCPSIFDSPMLKGGPSLFLMCFLGKL